LSPCHSTGVTSTLSFSPREQQVPFLDRHADAHRPLDQRLQRLAIGLGDEPHR